MKKGERENLSCFINMISIIKKNSMQEMEKWKRRKKKTYYNSNNNK